MTQFRRYLAEEVALDFGDRIISRREAMRRLGLLGVGVAAATAMLAACGDDAPARPAASTAPAGPSSAGATAAGGPTPTGTTRAGPTARPTEPVTFAGPSGRRLRGAWAAAASPRGTVLVIHENRGLTDHIRSVAGRLAASGYSSLAIDLLSEEGGTASLGDEGAATAALGRVPSSRFVADMKAGVDELKRRAPRLKTGTVGFCFGGGMVWSLLASGEPRLSAAAPFYGPLPDGADFSGSRGAAVLAVYAGLDDRVNATRDTATTALTRAGLTHEVVTVPNVNHAFFNDTGPRYDAPAAAAIYQRLAAWFGRYLA
jgi:carboxymethylenebutenolidase